MIGNTILHYKIIEKLGSPSEIIILRTLENDNFIISRDKGGVL